MFEEEQFADEHIGWPSYVDFLSSFVFVLIVFVGSLLYLLSGDIHQRLMDQKIRPIEKELQGAGIDVRREGNKLILPLQTKVEFETNHADIRPKYYRYLREVGKHFSNQSVKRIVILGFADSQPCRSDLRVQSGRGQRKTDADRRG
jgi:flagellar motor protein MotB